MSEVNGGSSKLLRRVLRLRLDIPPPFGPLLRRAHGPVTAGVPPIACQAAFWNV